MCVLSFQSCPTLWDLWTVARPASPSMGFSRQGYWSGLLCSSPGDLPEPGIELQHLLHCRQILYPLSPLGGPGDGDVIHLPVVMISQYTHI